ncbi:DUF6438 domain-containing protein [Hymenobacter arizonensis]|uniref:DUF6438 domain-containing protein n=1 Tax=Hymenobacter arizonensis TaxID=1227077 RepID=A0A1I6AUH0_HYMAR|nr:DUF6438 domain-containing protein [Hymenobacter arizonensis]SFQ72411.1 hypothetical protein SAMN04515668_3918 [Hymenobacter arizonensis]
MRYFTVLLLLLAFGLALPACAQKATATQKAKPKKVSKKAVAEETRLKELKAKQDNGPVLTFERTACFGKCPAYAMQVYADGRVEYEGRGDVPIMGKKELKMTPAAVAEVLRRAKEANFDQFKDRYSENTSDLPSTVVAIRQPNGQLKRVVAEEGEPTNVKMFFTYLSTQFDQLAQLGGVDR